MDRRNFLRSAGLTIAAARLRRVPALAQPVSSPDWQTYEVTTHVEILKPVGISHVWLPLPLTAVTEFQKPLGNRIDCPSGEAREVTSGVGPALVQAKFPAGRIAELTVVSRVATRNHTVDIQQPGASRSESDAALKAWLQPSAGLPLDGIVLKKATEITRGASTDIDKARAIYDWIVENTYRNAKIRGCGRGDIRFMLESGDMGGKCADLNALFVGLARASGLPARHAYGIRVGPSQYGYKSLGANTPTITTSQHCRAEVYLRGYGWVPADPADVRKVILEEPPGNLPITDEKVASARSRLFGSWEGNWIAWNYAADVTLPEASFGSILYFMYPQGETAEGRLDPFDPDAFRYTITSNAVAA
ncbi:transglutaminase-like domain-containing protein [Occallatibacter riparius]|uniref:Transglutaminase-like domain-containing protein n=1 Tax=Occallatibacter riparius TaxID=1002689 RepID=A0A9J7BUA5_9BACT|nr:transglutaminase-like domain-containing protein [Occallatibacter riparius]UWZ85314.1 transglutaminase-like domain-containing protein [Occallatibacter riparius]